MAGVLVLLMLAGGVAYVGAAILFLWKAWTFEGMVYSLVALTLFSGARAIIELNTFIEKNK